MGTSHEESSLIADHEGKSVVAVIADILDQAQERKHGKDVAQRLVGATLELRFGEGVVTPESINTPSLDQLADFRVGDAAIEVTTLERADESHLNQIRDILRNTGLLVWLLTRKRDREKWQKAIDAEYGDQATRVAVVDIETFVGQNMSEMGHFGSDTRATLASLFECYATRWLPKAGTAGLRIVDLETVQEKPDKSSD